MAPHQPSTPQYRAIWADTAHQRTLSGLWLKNHYQEQTASSRSTELRSTPAFSDGLTCLSGIGGSVGEAGTKLSFA